mgnify:CR=1 FL=1
MRPRTQIAALAVVVIIAIGTTALPAMAGTTDSSTGSFNLGNVAPQVTVVALYESNESTSASEMTPPTEYAVKIDVSDSNTLNDIDEIKVVIKKDGYSGSDDVHNQSTYKWTHSGWQFVGPTDTLWSLETSSAPGDLNATAGTWWLHFKPSKVATEANWDIEVTAKDNSSATSTNSTQDIPMRLYIEISAVDASYSFGNVTLNTTKNNITDPDDGNIGVTAIANGAYKLKSKTNTTWTGQNTSDVATVNSSSGTLDDGEIRLIDNAANNYNGGSKVKTDEYQAIAGYGSLTGPTDENGASHNIYQWLDVAAEGLLPDTYQGTYYVQIADA